MNRNSNTQIQMIADFEGDASVLIQEREAGIYPTLCTRDLVVFPSVLTPILIGRAESKELANMLEQNPETVFCIFCQKHADIDSPNQEDLYETGTFAKLMRVINMPNDEHQKTIIVQGLGRCKMKQIVDKDPFYLADVESLPETWPTEKEAEDPMFKALTQTFFEESIKFIQYNENIPNEAVYAINEITNRFVKCNFICTSLPFTAEDKIKMLEQEKLSERLIEALKALHKEQKLLYLQNEIRNKTQFDLDEQQKEYYLKQQIKNIKEELGEGESSPEKKELLEKAKTKKWNEATQKVFQKELAKLDNIHPQSPDYPIQLNYLQTLVDLPWGEYTEDDLSLSHAQKILNQDHYGMEKVKERILEYLAVRSLKGGMQSPILCLYGPPGVGKTSLGKSIAKAILGVFAPDYPIQLNYLQTLVDLPWGEYTEDDLSLSHAQKILNQDHYGMEKVKERILEYLAVRSLKGGMQSPILCLYGPPGVGKTSLGKSIAKAMKRKYVRMSLGGLHDEAEIRGHRRTYIGAMPGRIVKNILKAGSSNPVFILDEIDKVSANNHQGDPASALLEVLDPEQNNTFHDNYLDVDYDLSKVLFIATANDISSIHA
jgi:ATP-dependent Lon protease